MSENANEYLPGQGRIIDVRGSPGPAPMISADVIVRMDMNASTTRINNVKLVNLPDDGYDVKVPNGSGVVLVWRGNVAEFNALAWRPVVTPCGGGFR